MKRSYAYGLSFFSIAFILSIWLVFPVFPVLWLFLLIALASTPTVYVYTVGEDSSVKNTGIQRNDLDAVALTF